MKINVINPDKAGSQDAIELAEAVFAADYNESLIHQAVVAYQNGGRQGSRAQKTRSQVSGGGAKPRSQKGGGRARAGTIRSPIWRGGGVTFAAKPNDYTQKLNKKMRKQAMRAIYSELVRQGRLVAVQDIVLSEPKTKVLAEKLNQLSAADALIITKETNQNIELSARNLPKVQVSDANHANPVSLIQHEKVVVTVDALKHIEGALA